jgi:hypothetical protein
VVDEIDVGTAVAVHERHPQRVEHEVRAHVARELPADDRATECVDDEREEDHALPAAQVGQIGQPQLIGTLGAEVALHEVRAPA